MSVVMVVLILLVVVFFLTSAVLIAVHVVRAATSRQQIPPYPAPPHPHRHPHPPAPRHSVPQPGSLDSAGPAFPAYAPGQHLSPVDRERVVELLRSGRKIEAIKHYRLCTGAGLAEAKRAVEEIERFR